MMFLYSYSKKEILYKINSKIFNKFQLNNNNSFMLNNHRFNNKNKCP